MERDGGCPYLGLHNWLCDLMGKRWRKVEPREEGWGNIHDHVVNEAARCSACSLLTCSQSRLSNSHENEAWIMWLTMGSLHPKLDDAVSILDARDMYYPIEKLPLIDLHISHSFCATSSRLVARQNEAVLLMSYFMACSSMCACCPLYSRFL